MKRSLRLAAIAALLPTLGSPSRGKTAGAPGASDLPIAQSGASTAALIVSPQAEKWEKAAAGDLAKYMERMSGAHDPREGQPAGSQRFFSCSLAASVAVAR